MIILKYRIDNIIYERQTSKKMGIVESVDLENLVIVIDNNGIDEQYELSRVGREDESFALLNVWIG